ncbi:MAG: ABC transporter permease, partial [Pyrinomonadaceae bacterium]
LVPAIQTSKSDLNSILKEANRSMTGGAERERLRKLLVISEIALTMTLLIGASLLITSFFRLQTVPLGFEPNNVVVVYLDLPATKYSEPVNRAAFYNQLVERLNTTPGVKESAASDGLPFSGTNSTTYAVIGQPIPEVSKRSLTDIASVTPTYFGTMGIPLVNGRNFAESDRLDSSKLVIISKAMAERVFAGQNPIGQRLIVGSQSNDHREIIGVAGDVRPSLEENPREQVYIPMQQRPRASMSVVVRGTVEEKALLPAIRDAVRAIDSNQPITATMTMPQLIERSVSGRRLSMILMSLFAVLAMFMSAIGLSGTISYMVAQRTNEIGIRMALGAQQGHVIRLIVRQALRLTLLGVAIGLVAAFALSRFMSSLLYGVTATDPITFLSMSVLLVGVTLVASIAFQ